MQVLATLGAGGMGEVYRATDTNLKRSVAIKVLPASMAGDADRLTRFQREAEVLAALNHPNIAAICGLEKTPGQTALVMELVEGEDLSAVITRGALSLADALPIAWQIADALEAAHEQGIVHRDLKPQNIQIKGDGTVKVLDFGPVTTLDPSGGEIAHLYPQFLPDGRHFIYQAVTSAREKWAIFIGSIDSPVRRKLVQSDYAQFAAPNLLVHTQRDNLVAQTMELGTLTLTGQPEVLNVVGPPVTSSVVRLSPDGTRVALLEVPTSLWVADLARDVKAPVLRTQASSPTWSADGTRLLFGVITLTFDNQSALFERDAGGATPMKTLPAGKGFPRLLPFDETSDGTLVLFGRASGSGHRGIGMLSKADGKVTTYLDNTLTGSQAALSPDRRFLAYTSTETNPSQVIVQTFPDPSGGKWTISTRGGSAPRWRRDGRELFYVDAEQHLVSVPVTAGSSCMPGRATPLFSLPVSIRTDTSGAYGYDAAADGQRFLVSLPPEGASVKAPAIPLTVITNWTMLLKKGAR